MSDAADGEILPPVPSSGRAPRSEDMLEILPSGDSPLALRTWLDGDPSFLKLRSLIEVIDPEMSGPERKLFNALLAHACDASGRLPEGPHGVFWAVASDVKRAMGWERHNGNAKLKESIKRLQKVLITIDYFSAREGQQRERSINILTMSDVPAQAGIVYWQFGTTIATLLEKSGERARIYLKTAAKLSSDYALRLYELLSAHTQSGDPTWEVPVEDLRVLLNATAPSYAEWAIFQRRVLDGAVREVNKHAPFSVSLDLVKDKRTQRRTHVRFTVEAKRKELPVPERKPEAAPSPQGQLALDLPGAEVTAEASPMSPLALARRINARARGRLVEEFANVPLDDALNCWSAWVCRHGASVDRPARHFERWLRVMCGDALLAAGRGETVDWTEVFARPFDGTEHRAMLVLAGMVALQRRTWLNVAEEKHRQAHDRPLGIASLDLEHLHRWASLVADEVLLSSPA